MIDPEGVISKLNDFNLGSRTLTFSPTSATASGYKFQLSGDSYERALATAGTPLDGLGDDDSRPVDLPFALPFFGKTYQKLYVNSDGNLTFNKGDNDSTDRSLGRLSAGAARIAAFYADLDPSKAGVVSVVSEASRFVVSWADVPVYEDFGTGARQSFQIRLYRDGKIEVAFGAITSTEAVVGISPGDLQGSLNVLSFLEGSSAEFTAAVAERFTRTVEVDIVTAAQKFYQTHDDSYDYLVFYNGLGVAGQR